MIPKYTKEIFTNICNEKYNNKFTYDLTNFKNLQSTITITCPKHGSFTSLAVYHIRSKNNNGCCRGCTKESYSLNRTLNQEDVIKILNEKHDYKYDYSLMIYKSDKEKIDIICPIEGHGIFSQKANNHKSGQGCPKCKGGVVLNIDFYYNKIKDVNGDKYDYCLNDKNNFKNRNTKMNIICSTHGLFKQSYGKHIDGQGCPRCKNAFKYTKDEFIRRAKIEFDDKYDYSLSNYINNITNIDIICPIEGHGIFSKIPKEHLSRHSGCPKCSPSSIGEEKIDKILTEMNIVFERQKRFDKCVYKKKLSFDFYLPHYNLCIEYDGIYHFDVENKNIYSNYEYQKIRDDIKDKYCLDNNINLLRIKYTDYNNIEDILKYNLL